MLTICVIIVSLHRICDWNCH